MKFSSQAFFDEATLLDAMARKLRELGRIYKQQEGLSSSTAESNSSNSTPALYPGIKKPSRESQLVEWLKDHGPATFSDVTTKSGIPKGTVVTLLRKSKAVMKDATKKWVVKSGPL